MSIGLADLHTAIVTVWESSGLNAIFKALWDGTVDDNQYMVLTDSEGAPHQPFPYCVFTTERPRTITRMTGAVGIKNEVRQIPITFEVWADKVTGDARTPKQIAAYLAEEVMKIFGGHPTVASTPIVLANGGSLLVQFQNDYCERLELYKYMWSINYNFLVDVPVAV